MHGGGLAFPAKRKGRPPVAANRKTGGGARFKPPLTPPANKSKKSEDGGVEQGTGGEGESTTPLTPSVVGSRKRAKRVEGGSGKQQQEAPVLSLHREEEGERLELMFT